MKLKDWRRRNSRTQADVARALNVHPLTVSTWERGDKRPDAANMEAIATLTGGAVQPNDFFALPQERAA